MGTRMLLAIGMTACAAWTGRSVGAVGLRRAKLLATVMDELQWLRTRMLERWLPMEAALALSTHPIFMNMAAHVAEDGALRAWQMAKRALSARGEVLDSLLPSDIEALDQLFDGFGEGTREEQALKFSAALSTLGALQNDATRASGERVRLYGTLGALAGVALSIWLI